jgi:Asp-tRNA(Asn)/Glu-tRNA(Gln) amidotransferase A subunit family amidase
MTSDDLCFLSATEMARLLRERTVSSAELVDAHLQRIERHDDALRAFIEVLADDARAAAREADEALADGRDRRPLLGLPVAVKDEAAVAGRPGTFGCLALRDHVAEHDAPYTRRLRDAGAIVLGITNLPEFGHRATTVNRLRGATSTPFAIGMNAGGSSGGSAAAVAAGMAAFAHGSDGGGSVRIPAAMCGVVGLIGSCGRVPRVTRPDGFNNRWNVPFDGILARTVEDAVTGLRTIAGYDGRDPASLPGAVPAWSIPDAPAQRLRVGWTPDFGAYPVEPSVVGVVRRGADALAEAGARVEDAGVDLGCTADEIHAVLDRYLSLVLAAADAVLTTRGVQLAGDLRDAVDPVVVAHVEAGREIAAVDAKLDDLVRTRVLDGFAGAFERFDVLAAPTVAIPGISNERAQQLDAPLEVAGTAVDPLLGWILTAPVNFCGYPAVSVPAGQLDGLPIGIQIVAPHGREDLCIRAAAAIERSLPWHGAYARARRALDAHAGTA